MFLIRRIQKSKEIQVKLKFLTAIWKNMKKYKGYEYFCKVMYVGNNYRRIKERQTKSKSLSLAVTVKQKQRLMENPSVRIK